MDTLTRRSALVGLMAGLALGLAALAGCSSDSQVVTPVVVPPLRSVTVTPDDTSLTVGQSVVLTAVALDTSGAVVSGIAFAWSSSDAGVATVSAGGVLARGEGDVRIIASLGGKSDTTEVHVSPATAGWYAQSSGVVSALNGVYARPGGRRVWAVGAAGQIRASTDAGVTWTGQTSNTAADLNAVWFTSDTEGWAVGNAGVLRHTTNGGGAWSVVSSGASEHLYDVVFATPDTGWVVGSTGVVLRTFDHGASWTRTVIAGADLRGVSFFGTRYGWAVGDNGTLASTTDRGLNWTVITPALTALDLRSVWRTSLLRANAVGTGGAAPRCADDGFGAPEWTLLNPGAGYQFRGVCFTGTQTGWAVGVNGTGFVLRSDDGGASWSPQTASSTNALNDVFFIDAERGWAVGNGGEILHTATGGLTP
jgi:photosystem II stability/assembly factor-like uncharacterized protein